MHSPRMFSLIAAVLALVPPAIGQTDEKARIIEELKALEPRLQAVARKAVEVTVGLKSGPGHASGVIVTKDGYVLTAAHCFRRPHMDVKLVLHDGREVRAKTLGREEKHDFGLVKIVEEGEWPFARMGDSSKVKKHDFVVGTGNPYELVPGRPAPVRVGWVEDVTRFIRTTCRVAPGDSGGPLFDLDGRVIGIHSFISAGMTYNFQVPVNRYRDDWERLKKGEEWNLKRRRGPEATFGVEVEGVDGGGVRIARLEKDGPAEKAGLRKGDVILYVGRRTVLGPRSFKLALGELTAGKEVTLKIRRGKDVLDVKVTPGAEAAAPGRESP